MTIFAVLMPVPQQALAEKIEKTFGDNCFKLSDTQYLVSTAGTATELTIKLGMYDPKQINPPTGRAVVLAVSSYFGRAPSNVWEWMKARLEAPPHG